MFHCVLSKPEVVRFHTNHVCTYQMEKNMMKMKKVEKNLSVCSE